MGSTKTNSRKRKDLAKRMRDRGATDQEIQIARDALAARQQARDGTAATPPPPPPQPKLRQLPPKPVDPDKAEFDRLVALHGLAKARDIVYHRVPELDGRGYQPAYRDPLLHGPARATGQTARAVKARRTVTGWQHTEREGR